MDPLQDLKIITLKLQEKMKRVIHQGDSAVQQFYSGTSVLVTGGCGFLGKPLIEKLFRSCKIKNIYMLVRPKKGKTVEERIRETLKDPCFDLLRETQPSFADRIVAIEGDVSELGLGISEENKQIIINEVEIIFHAAASVVMAQPLRSATLTNIRGTREIINLAKQCAKLKSFVYVSTAYSHAIQKNVNTEVMEKFYPCPVSPDLMINLAETLEEEKLNALQNGLISGWPNTYSFSKALAEEQVRISAEDLPLCVVRPVIVISAYREPEPGWIDTSSVFGPSGIVLGVTMGVIRIAYGANNIRIDFVPVDYVVNAIIVAATTAKQHPMMVYNISSSVRNPLLWGQMDTHMRKEIGYRPTRKAMWYCCVTTVSSEVNYKMLSFILHTIPAYLVDFILMIAGQKPRFKKLYTKIHKLSKIFALYNTCDWIFVSDNTLKMYENLSKTDQAIYHFDVMDIDWAQNIKLWWYGLRKHVIKDGLKDTKCAMKKQICFMIIHYLLCAIILYVFYLLFKFVFNLF